MFMETGLDNSDAVKNNSPSNRAEKKVIDAIVFVNTTK